MQVNKNWLVKGRLGSDAAAFAVALKAWWQPSMTLGLAAVYDFNRRLPRFGITYTLENYGNIRCRLFCALEHRALFYECNMIIESRLLESSIPNIYCFLMLQQDNSPKQAVVNHHRQSSKCSAHAAKVLPQCSGPDL